MTQHPLCLEYVHILSMKKYYYQILLRAADFTDTLVISNANFQVLKDGVEEGGY